MIYKERTIKGQPWQREIDNFIKRNSKGKVLIVTDENIFRIYASKLKELKVPIYVIEAGEASKSFEVYGRLINQMSLLNMDRSSTLIAFGGGVVGDLTGFAASTYQRGVHFIQVPTSLLAMVDSSIGGKTGINFNGIKNNVGTFYTPDSIIVDYGLLDSLPQKEAKNGFAEIIKTAAIADEKLFEELETGKIILGDAIERAMAIKQAVVNEDFKENGKRAILNFGHSFGHAIESALKYKLGHGFAVAWGMVYITKLLAHQEVMDPTIPERLYKLMDANELLVPLDLSTNDLIDLVVKDKKRRGDAIRLIYLEKIGQAQWLDVSLSELSRWVKEMPWTFK